ncbi:hypothetical protein D3C86_1209800 [compost metagenome]
MQAAVRPGGADGQAQLQVQVLQQILVIAVVRGGGDGDMEGNVMFHALLGMFQMRFQIGQRPLHGGEVGGIAADCRQGCRAAFQLHPQLVDTGQLLPVHGDAGGHLEALRAGARHHGAARALAALDQALRPQALGDFTDHGGADAVLFRQDAPRGQLGADGMNAAGDLRGDLAGDLLGKGKALGQHGAIISRLLRLSDNF